jgi:hypothetical protein
MKRFSFLLILCFSLQAMAQSPDRVIYLKNEKISVGILKDVGGRIVFFGTPGGDNFLYSDSSLWNEPEAKRVIPTSRSFNKPYCGFITWAGPQSQWWNFQNVNPSRKNAVWPPDPFIEFGAFEIKDQTATSITIVGQVSEISGLQLTKSFTIKDNKLEIKVSARNGRNETVSWDLWSNLRFDAYTNFWIPASEKSLIKFDKEETDIRSFVPYSFEGNKFKFTPPTSSPKLLISKVFLYPTEGAFFVQKESGLMVVKFDLVDRKLIHPEQGLVEVYNCISPKGESNILELEHHSAFKTLAPNESMELTETWEIKPVD